MCLITEIWGVFIPLEKCTPLKVFLNGVVTRVHVLGGKRCLPFSDFYFFTYVLFTCFLHLVCVFQEGVAFGSLSAATCQPLTGPRVQTIFSHNNL